MLIDESRLKHWIENFYGYGSWNAEFWFVSFEEGGGNLPEDVADRVNFFYDSHGLKADRSLCDIRHLYRHALIRWEGLKRNQFENLYEFRFGDHAVKNNVWTNLIAFEAGFTGRRISDPLEYQKNVFASVDGKEALVKLYPLPSANHHGWYYSWLELQDLTFIRDRNTYLATLYPSRIATILQNIAAHRPAVVLMYGMNNITTLKGSVKEAFGDVKFRTMKAIKSKIPQYHKAELGKTTLLITTQIPALRHNRIETGFDWEAFGRSVKGHS